jgi:uncharacterized protein (TIGR00297 family)
VLSKVFFMASARSEDVALRWQSGLLLAFVVIAVLASVLMQSFVFFLDSPWVLVQGAAIAAGFGLLVWGLRAATAGAALTGSLFTLALYFAAPGWRNLLWPLLALFVLTFAATRFGRARKEELQVAEERRGRSASQVAANLGMAGLASIAVSASRFFALSAPIPGRPMLIALVAALAEATADTVSSEMGEVLGGEPVLLTTLRRVPAGTDGAVSLTGTLAGCAGAAIIALIAVLVLPMTWSEGLAATAAGVLGLFFDSLLGATLERRGWLNNDAVNFLSTCAAALCGALISAA